MKHLIIFLTAFFLISGIVNGQRFYTKNGNISFFSRASLENIQADNNQVMCVLDTKTGDMQFSLLIKSFHFKKALMEEHFNENYLESDKFPKATFNGNISGINTVNFSKDGVYEVSVSGDISIHGTGKKITSNGSITISGGKISLMSKFFVKVADYNINIPRLVKDNIAESVEITVSGSLDQKM